MCNKSSLGNANLVLLEVLIENVLKQYRKDGFNGASYEATDTLRDLARFMGNETSYNFNGEQYHV